MQLVGAEPVFQTSDESLRACVGPDDGVVQGFAGRGVPDDGCLALVGEADGFDGAGGVAVVFEGFDGAFDAGFDRGDDFEGVVLVPSVRGFVSLSFSSNLKAILSMGMDEKELERQNLTLAEDNTA